MKLHRKMHKRAFHLVFLISICSMALLSHDKSGNNSFRFVAHRGASYLAPENTLSSINLAWELGADAAECDVMLTADNRVVLFHDKNTKRLTGHNHVVSDASWEALSKLTILLSETNLPEYRDEPIPLLKDILGTIPADRMLVIEIKTGPEIIPYLKKVVDNHWMIGKISFIAFDFETIKAIKALYPEVPCYFLAAFKTEVKKHFDAAVEIGLDGLDLRHGIIDQKLARQCREAGLDLWCWTVNDPETAARMKALGVTALTTDRPKWLRENMADYRLIIP